MWPVASTAWLTGNENGTQSGTKHGQCTPPAENVSPQGLHQRLGCPLVHGKQEQKCPDGIPSAHCLTRTMPDVPDRAGAGAETQPSDNTAIPASPNSHQSRTSSLVQESGTLSQLQHWRPVGLKNWQKETSWFQLPPGQLDLA